MLAVALGTTGCLWLLGGEQRVGDAAAEQVEREMGFVDDPELNAYLRQIGERLAAQSSREGRASLGVLDLQALVRDFERLDGGLVAAPLEIR